MLLCELALSHMKAKNLDELVSSQSRKEADSMQLNYLKKTLVKEEAQAKAKVKKSEPVFVKTDDGGEVDLRDYEIYG